MSVLLLEMQRARTALEAFCSARNPVLERGGKCLRCRQHGTNLVLSELRRPAGPVASAVSVPLVRLVFRDGKWFLYWRAQGGDWMPYPHLPETDSVQRIIDELEQAPLHVYWG